MSSPFLATQDRSQHKGADPWEFAEICLQRTAGAIHQIRAATPAEISQAISSARENHASGKPSDLLEVLPQVQGHEVEHLGAAILELADQIAHTLSPYAPVLPFAGKLITPSAFYESFDSLYQIARVLQTPVVYVEDTDAIGVASANPVAGEILAEEIRDAVFKRFGIRPFVTVARLNYEDWTHLTRKHFEL